MYLFTQLGAGGLSRAGNQHLYISKNLQPKPRPPPLFPSYSPALLALLEGAQQVSYFLPFLSALSIKRNSLKPNSTQARKQRAQTILAHQNKNE